MPCPCKLQKRCLTHCSVIKPVCAVCLSSKLISLSLSLPGANTCLRAHSEKSMWCQRTKSLCLITRPCDDSEREMTQNAHSEADEQIQEVALGFVVGAASHLLTLTPAERHPAALGTSHWRHQPGIIRKFRFIFTFII